MDEEYTNPYPPGSDAWHLYNLGIKPGVIGQVTGVTFDEKGMLVKGWFWGEVPKTFSGWSVDGQTGEAHLIEKEE